MTRLVRSLAIGVAAGMRSSLGFSAPGLLGPGGGSTGNIATAKTAGRVLAIVGEIVTDKLPQTPSRLKPAPLLGRLVAGGAGALALARRDGTAPTLPVLVGVLGAGAGSYGGAAWRRWAAARRPDWQGALAEDAVALALATVACLPS